MIFEHPITSITGGVVVLWLFLDIFSARTFWQPLERKCPASQARFADRQSNGRYQFGTPLGRPEPCFLFVNADGLHIEPRFPAGWFRSPILLPRSLARVLPATPGLFGDAERLEFACLDMIITPRGNLMDVVKIQALRELVGRL